jgi:hypothetical protein
MDGRGLRVVVAGERGKGDAELYNMQGIHMRTGGTRSGQPDLFALGVSFIFRRLHTMTNLAFSYSDGTMFIDMPFSRLLGKPPIMVAGMSPTTVKGGFASAVLDAGYHIELAGGGHYNAAALRLKVAEITSKIPAGVGLTLNSLYIIANLDSSFPCGRKCARRAYLSRDSALLQVFLVPIKLLRSNTLLSSQEVWMAFDRLLTLLLRVTQISPSFSSGQEAALEAITLSRISTSPYSSRTVPYVARATSVLSPGLGLVPQKMFGCICRETGPLTGTTCSQWCSTVSSLPAVLWSQRKPT